MHDGSQVEEKLEKQHSQEYKKLLEILLIIVHDLHNCNWKMDIIYIVTLILKYTLLYTLIMDMKYNYVFVQNILYIGICSLYK